MCWSKDVSLAMGVLGSAAGYYAYNHIDRLFGISIWYFTLMQIIHYVGYLYVDKCNNKINQGASYLNYIHICFQPFFFGLGMCGLLGKYKIITKAQITTYMTIIYFSLFASVSYLLRLVPFKFYNHVVHGGNLERTGGVFSGKLCSIQGDKHVYFTLPLRNQPYYVTASVFFHFLFFFCPLFIFNNITRLISIFVMITAYTPVFLYNVKMSEGASLWCNISILQLIIVGMIVAYKSRL